jgi:hypothetical protein
MENFPHFDFRKQEDRERFNSLPAEDQEHIIDAAHEEALGLVLAKTLNLEYESGGVAYESGVKAHRVDYNGEKNTRVDGRKVVKGGNGSYAYAMPSQFHLWVRLPDSDDEVDIWTSQDFRDILGITRLTEKIRRAIELSQPEFVALKEHTSERGTKYFRLDPAQLSEWADRAQEKMKDAGAAVREEKRAEKEAQADLEKRAKRMSQRFERWVKRAAEKKAAQTNPPADMNQLMQQLKGKYEK